MTDAERIAQLEEVLRKMIKACGCLIETKNAEPMCCTCCKLAVRALGGKRTVAIVEAPFPKRGKR